MIQNRTGKGAGGGGGGAGGGGGGVPVLSGVTAPMCTSHGPEQDHLRRVFYTKSFSGGNFCQGVLNSCEPLACKHARCVLTGLKVSLLLS